MINGIVKHGWLKKTASFKGIYMYLSRGGATYYFFKTIFIDFDILEFQAKHHSNIKPKEKTNSLTIPSCERSDLTLKEVKKCTKI